MTARVLSPGRGAATGTTSLEDGSGDWRDQSACLTEDPELFHAADGEHRDARPYRVALAKAVCATCPVKTTCYADAVENLEQYAVRGGEDFSVIGLRGLYRLRDTLRQDAA